MVKAWWIVAAAVAMAPARDDKSELLAAAKKVAEAKSCSFRGETRLVLPEGLDRAGGGDPVKFEGRAEREGAAWVRTDAFEYFMAGGKTVVRPVAEWRPLRDDGTDIQRMLHHSLAGARPPRPPHEEFATWPRAVQSVKKTETREKVGDKECRIYEVEFSGERARELVQQLFPMGRWMDRIPIDRPAAAARAWINGEGRILKAEIVVKVSGTIQGNSVQMSATRVVTIGDYDAVKVQMPEEARKALEAK